MSICCVSGFPIGGIRANHPLLHPFYWSVRLFLFHKKHFTIPLLYFVFILPVPVSRAVGVNCSLRKRWKHRENVCHCSNLLPLHGALARFSPPMWMKIIGGEGGNKCFVLIFASRVRIIWWQLWLSSVLRYSNVNMGRGFFLLRIFAPGGLLLDECDGRIRVM